MQRTVWLLDLVVDHVGNVLFFVWAVLAVGSLVTAALLALRSLV